MAFTITTDIFCDKCGDWVHGVASYKVSVTEARKIARQQGWSCPLKTAQFQKDLCPICNGRAIRKIPQDCGGGYEWKK